MQMRQSCDFDTSDRVDKVPSAREEVLAIEARHRNYSCDFPEWFPVVLHLSMIAFVAVVFMQGRVPTSTLMFALWGWAILFGVVIVYAVVTGRSAANANEDSEGARSSVGDPARWRLKCYGNPKELYGLRAIEPHFFEPVRGYLHAYPMSRRLVWVPFLVMMVGLVLWRRQYGYAVSLFVGTLLVLAAIEFFRQPLFRVVPGRLDVFRRRAFGMGPRFIRTIPLKNAQITCRYDERRLTVAPENGEDVPGELVIDLWPLRNPHEFSRAVFRGAVWQGEPPPIPDDETSG